MSRQLKNMELSARLEKSLTHVDKSAQKLEVKVENVEGGFWIDEVYKKKNLWG